MRYKIVHRYFVTGIGMTKLTPPLSEQSFRQVRSLSLEAHRMRRHMTNSQGVTFTCNATEYGYVVKSATEEVKLVRESFQPRRGQKL